MLLTASHIKLYMVSKNENGHVSETTLRELTRSVVGGTKIDDYEITTDADEARLLQQKYTAIGRVKELMENMTPQQASAAVDAIQGQHDLMMLDENYA